MLTESSNWGAGIGSEAFIEYAILAQQRIIGRAATSRECYRNMVVA